MDNKRTNDIGNMFIHSDPFLSLDHDLDDVSEVIRNHNLFENPNLFDSSRTPSPQYYRDTNIFTSPNNNELVFPKIQPLNYSIPPSNQPSNNTYDREIGEIVSLLQDENTMLSSPGPSSTSPQQYDSSFGAIQIKQDYSMMDTSPSPQIEPIQLQYASTSMEYHQMAPTQNSPNMPFNHFNYDQPVQSYPIQYNMPRASSSSALSGMIGAGSELQQVVIDETTLIRPQSDQNINLVYSSYPNSQYMSQQSTVQIGQESNSSSDGNTKQELIKMLLEMSPGDFERLRSQKVHQKHRKASAFKATSPTSLDPIRKKRSSLQLATSPQPLLVSVGSDPSLEMSRQQSAISPCLISPETTSKGFNNEWCDGSDNESSYIINSMTRKGPKTERRTAHNLIEKKYRCSINDRINHLKEMLAPEEAKLSKSATLRKAIDHILCLRQHNEDLKRENELLKKSIKALGAEVPLIVTSSKHSRHASVAVSIADDSSESVGSAQSSNSNSPQQPIAKKSAQMLNQSRISLCVFMFMLVMTNPFATLFGPSVEGNKLDAPAVPIIGRIPIQHRTLKAFDNEYPFEESSPPINWWYRAFTRNTLIWLINVFIVFMILTRLLVYGEPVTDRRSSTYVTFVKIKKHAHDSIGACNYKEAQRQLSDALFILGRALPRPGGIDELMSFTWQVIRHILNGIWIGRWFSRRRRNKTMSSNAVCRSHASTALVYHQLNQLHLLGIDAIERGPMTGLNLALCAVNLAESAGISQDGITHKQRADIYIHAAICCKLSLPRFLNGLVFSYFLKRARRHVRKSSMVNGIEMKQYQWIFHPLSQNFLSDINVLQEIMTNNRQSANFPFSHSYLSPKPIDRLTSAFKMHLLALLMDQLSSSVATLRLVDFVDISHLLLNTCMSDSPQLTTLTEDTLYNRDGVLDDWEAPTKGQADELCTWFSHVLSCSLYWKYGDRARAQKHYSLIRKCPQPLLQSYLALGVGMGLCTRKICMEDQHKKEFVNMVWFHVKESFLYIRKNEPLNPRKSSTMAIAMSQFIRSITYEWLLNSMIDVWRLNLEERNEYWNQPAPTQLRQLYREVLNDFAHCGVQPADKFKILLFKSIARLLDGGNPMTTWKHLSTHCLELMDDVDSAPGIVQAEIIKRLQDDLTMALNAKICD